MQPILARWGALVARRPFLIIIGWAALIVAALHFGPSLGAVAATQHLQTLPSSAPSVRAASLYATKFAGGQQSLQQETDVVVLADPQGISATDTTLINQLATWLNAPATRPAHLARVVGPGGATPVTAFESNDHQAVRFLLTWDSSNSDALQGSIDQIDHELANLSLPPNASLGLVGAAPVTHALESGSFGSTGGVGSLVGILLILIVFGFVYRSPLAILLPFMTIGVALGLAIPAIAWFGQTFGLSVATFSLEYVIFVVLGTGTNYALFFLSRYREELQHQVANDRESRQAALVATISHIGEAIMSSAATVVVALGILGLGQLGLLRVIGPAVAVAVACLLLANLTLLPALMAITGNALFWPARPKPATVAGTAPTPRGVWATIGTLVTSRPRCITGLALVVVVPLAALALTTTLSFDDLQALPAQSPAAQTYRTYTRHFADAAQLQVFVSDPGVDLRQPASAPALAQLAKALGTIPHVTGVQTPAPGDAATQSPAFATDGSAVVLNLQLDQDPASSATQATVAAIDGTAHTALQHTSLGSATILLGGQGAQVRDEMNQLGQDFRLVALLVGLAILLILILLVRSLTAPLYLLGTIALSAGAAIGLTTLVYQHFLNLPVFYIVPIFAFVFLVALGEDFNILTITRIREEIRQHGHQAGIARAVALTGGVVSSCGLVMAASFSRLTGNAIIEISELGFALVVGVLIDTFLVRPLFVPALVTLLGRWNWVWVGHDGLQPRVPSIPSPVSQM